MYFIERWWNLTLYIISLCARTGAKHLFALSSFAMNQSCPYLMIKILTLHYFELGEFVTSALLSSINSIVMHSCNVITKYSVCQLFDSVYLQVIFRGVSSYRKMIRAMGSLSGEITQSMWSQSKQVIKCACAPEQFGLKLCFYC